MSFYVAQTEHVLLRGGDHPAMFSGNDLLLLAVFPNCSALETSRAKFLADGTVMLYCRLSVRPCATPCIVALRVGVGVQSICFFRHFCCRMYRLTTKHSEKRICRNFRVWNGVIIIK